LTATKEKSVSPRSFFRRLPLSVRLLGLIIPTVVLAIGLYGYLNARIIGRMLDTRVAESTRDAAMQLAEDLAGDRIPTRGERMRTWLRELMDANFFIVRIDVFELAEGRLEMATSTSGTIAPSALIDEEIAVRHYRILELPQFREKQRLLKVIAPFRTKQGTIGCVSLVSSLQQSDLVAQIHDRVALYLVPATVLILVLLLQFLFARGITRRIDRMSQVMREARSRDFSVRVPVGRDDELGTIARSFNDTMDEISNAWQERDRLLEERERSNALLQERIREATQDLAAANERLRQTNEEILNAQRQLTQAERMAVVCQMAATFAHEIGSPLSAVSTHLQLLVEERGTDGDTARRLQLIQEQISRITGYVEELLSATRAAVQVRTDVQLNEVLERLLLFLEQHLARRRVRVLKELGPNLPAVLADADQLQQVFLNLVNNACDAMPDGGELTLTTALEPGDQGRSFVVARVSDTGTGIPIEKQERIFEPFFTTKEFSGGTGLGLSVTARIVRQHGGDVSFTSRPSGGTTFVVRLPALGA
jgi:two-component system, NtrC family, sensor kinase